MATKKRRGRDECGIYQKTITRKNRDGTERKASTYWCVDSSQGHDPITGRRVRKVFYFALKSDAQAKSREIGQSLKRPRAGKAQHQRLVDYLSEWLLAVNGQIAPTTERSYRQTVKLHIVPYIGNVRLAEFDGNRVETMYRALKKAGVSASMQQRVHTILRIAMNAAVRRGLLPTSPLVTIAAPRYRRPPVKALTVAQSRAFLAEAKGHRLEALFVLALTTGMREGELFGLRWDDVDTGQRCLQVTRSIREVNGQVSVADTKTQSGRRRITLTGTALAALDQRRTLATLEGHGSPYCFTTAGGRLLRKSNFLRSDFAPVRAAAKIPVSFRFHDLRHTAASLLLLQNASPKVVQELLGHSDVALTLRTYAHVLPGMQDAAVAAMDAILGSFSS